MNDIIKEYEKLKQEFPEYILLFQSGIFLRIINEDAKKVFEILGLKLRVEGGADNPVYFCGFPENGLDKYVGKLVRAGFSVAILKRVKNNEGNIQIKICETICLKT